MMLDIPPELHHLMEKRLLLDRRSDERRLYDLGPQNSVEEKAEEERRDSDRRNEERRDS
jgi:hypothetical protein